VDISKVAVGDDPICRVSVVGELFAASEAPTVANRILDLAADAERETLERIRAGHDN
jgi:hypothetical protein